MIKEQNKKKKDASEIKPPKDWEEVETPFFRFENIGDSIEGTLIDIKEVEKFNIYTINKFDGETIRFHGSTQLDDLMNALEDLPCYVKVLFAETKPTPKGDLKIFKVFKGSN